jgi:hypothetical protein
MKAITALIDIFLASLSFIFYKVSKFAIGTLYLIYLQLNKKIQTQWRVLSADTIAKPLVMPVLMTKAPRWNTHAIICTLGPFPVKEKISIDLSSIRNSAAAWICVVYSFPQYATITSISNSDVDPQPEWYDLPVKSGRYTIGLRYYQRRETLQTPMVKVDGQFWASSEAIDPQVNDFYHRLLEKKNWFYLSLHWYIYTLLQWQDHLPSGFVKAEYLPVGATHTQFFYNAVPEGEEIEITIDPVIVATYDIYFNLYDRSSLPISWLTLEQLQFTSPPLNVKSTYLLRVRTKDKSTANVTFTRQSYGVTITLPQN